MLNQAIIHGRMTAEPELRYTSTNKPYTTVTVAVQRDYDRQQADFITVKAWGKTATFIFDHFHKGQPILIAGEIRTDTYEKNGQRQYSTYINAERIDFAGMKKETPNII